MKVNLSLVKKSQPFIIVILLVALILQLDFFKEKFGDILNLKKPLEKIDDQKINKPFGTLGFISRANKSFIDSTLINSNDLEEFLYKVLRPLREVGISQIQQSSIDSLTSRNEAKTRASEISRQILAVLQYDYDKNWKITQQEFDLAKTYRESFSENRFITFQMDDQQITKAKALDLNNDNVIDQSEILQVKESENKIKDRAVETLESLLKLDPNNDKILTVTELKEIATKLFKSVDLNQDDVLSKDEKEIFVKSVEEKSKEEETSKIKEKLNIDGDEELHVVGVYEGKIKNKESGNVSIGTINVTVDRPNKKVILIVSSYRALKWNITSTKGTEIKNIILSSYEKNSEILLNGKNFQLSDFKMESRVYKSQGQEFVKFKNEVKEKIGLDISSFSGTYAAGEEPFIINSVSNDKTLKSDYLKTNYPDGNLPKITFSTVINGVKGEYDVKGNLTKESPKMPDNSVYLEKQKQYYQIVKDGVSKYDEAGNLLEELKLSIEVPRFSWPKGIIYDEANNRVVVLTSHVNSYLYFYDLKSKKWTTISLGVAKSFSDITYDKDNKNYVLVTEPSEESGILISWLNNKGELVNKESIPLEAFSGLSDIYDPGNGPSPEIRIFVEKDYFVITANSDRHFNRGKSGIKRIYLCDKKNKKVYLTWFSKD